MKKYLLATAALAMAAVMQPGLTRRKSTPGKALNMMLLPKFLGILAFDQAHQGAQEAHEGAAELRASSTSSGRPPRTASPARSSS